MGNTISANAHKAYLNSIKSQKDIGTGIHHESKERESAVKNIALGALKLIPGVDNLTNAMRLYGSNVSLVKGIEQLTGKDLSGLKKAAAVTEFVPSKLKAGAMGAMEGLTDFLAGGGAQVAGQKDAAKWIYEHSWSQDLSGSADVDEELNNGSNGYRIASDVITGIGNVGFQVGVGLATGGLASAGKISTVAAKGITFGTLFAEGAGSGTAEAVQKTGNVGWKENVAGLGSGAIEVATEMISPTGKMIRGKISGKTVDETAKFFSKHFVAKSIISDFGGEFVEEFSSAGLNWVLQSKILKIDDSPINVKDWVYEGIMGGIGGAVFSAPQSVSSVRLAQKTGAKVYAQGEQAVKDKINAGKAALAEMQYNGLDTDPRFSDGYKIAQRALMELETNEKLTQKQKELYLGLAETAVTTTEMRSTMAEIAEQNAEMCAKNPAYAQSVADSMNAIVNEQGGEGKYTAADFADPNSGANQVFALAKLFERVVKAMPSAKAIREKINLGVEDFTGDKAQKKAISELQGDDVATYRIKGTQGAYVMVTKRQNAKGNNVYSVGYTTAENLVDDKWDNRTFVVGHNMTLEQAVEAANAEWTEQQVREMIEGVNEEAEQQRLIAEAEAQEKSEEAKKPEPKKEEASEKKKKQNETKKTAEKKTAEKKTVEKKEQKSESKETAPAEPVSEKAKKESAEITRYRKYEEIRKEHPDSVVAMRRGNFYIVYGNDATEIAKRTQLKLLKLSVDGELVPSVAIPYEDAQTYFDYIEGKVGDLIVVTPNGKVQVYGNKDSNVSFSPAKKSDQTEQTTEKKTTEKKKQASPEDLSEVEKRLTIDLGIDTSPFTREEWVEARKYVPGIDSLSDKEIADVLMLVRTGNAAQLNKEYLKGLVRITSAFNIPILFDPTLKVKGFEIADGGAYILINPANLNETYAHELFHTFEKKNGKTRKKLVESVKKIVGEERFNKEKEQYKKDFRAQFGYDLSDAKLDGEATANVIGKYLSNMTTLRKLAAKDEGLGRRLLTAIRTMKENWQTAKAFAKENNSTTFAEYRKIEQIENLLMKELGYNKAVNAKNGRLIEFTDSEGTVSYNVKTYREQVVEQSDGTKKSGRELIEARLKKQGYADSDISQFLARLDAVADEMEKLGGKFPILNKWNNVALTYKDGELIFSSLVANGEYEINFDFSTVCKHREAFTKVLNKIVEIGRGGELNLTPKKIAQINAILKEEGFETACKMCFVEGKRNGIKNWATTFVDGRGDKKGWNYLVRQVYGDNVGYADFGVGELTDEEVLRQSGDLEKDLAKIAEIERKIEERYARAKKEGKSVKANINEMMFELIKSDKKYAFLLKPENLYGSKGVSQLKRTHPEIYSILLRSYGQGSPKITLDATPYADEFNNLANRKGVKKLAEETFRIGGARLQSFSDFQMIRFLDYCQLIANGASIGAAMQCYTKEIDMVHLFGLTGMKINMSLVPSLERSGKGDYAGLKKNADGTWDYAIASESIQPYDYVDENGVTRHGAFWYQNQEGYKENCGTILIGVSKYQILKAMADPNIRMIIPYHKSGLSKTMAELLGIAAKYDDKTTNGFTDYEKIQHTRKQNKDGKWVNLSASEEFDFYEAYLRLKGDAKAACQEYIDWCEKKGYRPKFFEPGAKYEGIVYNADGSINENYYKLIEDFSCYDGDGVAHRQRAVDLVLPDDWTEVVARGVGEAQDVDDRLSNRIGDIIDKVFSAKESEKNADIWRKNTELEQKANKPGFTKPSDTSYSPAPVTPETDSRYLSLARDPQKNESELRRLVKEAAEKAGFPSPMLYHGTNAYGFTSVDTSAPGGDGYSFWASNSETTSATYTQNGAVREIGSELTEEQVEQMVDKRSEELDDTIRDFCSLIDKHFSEWFFGYDGGTNTVRTIVEQANPEPGNGDGVYDELLDLVMDAYDRYGDEYQSAYEEFADWQENSKEFEEIEQAIVDVEGAYSALRDVEANGAVGGIYQLYANLDNMLVIEGNGAVWNNLHPDNLPKLERYGVKDAPYTTRDVAKWAKNNGYDGVIFKNIKDNGQYGRTPASDVYAFFKPKAQVKSADLVTYDNSGNIIPLSERFNPQNDDIRYSPASDAQHRVVTRVTAPRRGIVDTITNKNGDLSRANVRRAIQNLAESAQIMLTNAQQAIENQLVRAGMTKREAAAWSQWARTARAHGSNAIQVALADMNGKIRARGLMQIIEPFLAKKGEVCEGYDAETGKKITFTAKGGELAGKLYLAFSDYLGLLNAIDREVEGKNPYSSMSADEMKRRVAEYEKNNPNFKKAADELSEYNAAVLDIGVQSGLMSQEFADKLRKMYPHYITMRTMDSTGAGKGAVKGARNIEINRGIKAATESDHRADDPLKSYAEKVQSFVKAAKLNMVYAELYATADGENVIRAEASQERAKELREMEKRFLKDPTAFPDPTELFRKFADEHGKMRNEITFYKDGKAYTMAVSDHIFTGVSDLAGTASSFGDLGIFNFVKKANDIFKKLVTNWNPFFGVKNILRDLQDGSLQTRYSWGEFINEYRKNAQMMASGKFDERWTLFVASGALEASLVADNNMAYKKSNKAGLEQAEGIIGQFQRVSNFNTLTEALPRFTEFCLTLKHGGTIQQALYNAADVTVNFGRSGKLVRVLNATVMPFLNPAVQGMDRVLRLFTEDGWKNNKALASLLIKAILLAILPMALSNAMYGGDDEYEDMKDSVKENNYLFKVGDTWLKLPRGRVVSTIAGLYNRSSKQLTGKDVDWGDYGKNVLDQITPAQNFIRHIGSPFVDVANNKTWYGSAIESQSLQNYAVKDRYDENTSRVSVWIGQFTSHFGLSPKKVNYLLDQYTGVIGDILLPTTTPAGTRGVVSYNFTVDQNTTTNLSNRFYDLYNKTMYAANGGDEEAYYLKRRLDETKNAASELFKEIKTINADSSLSNKEKVKQASAIRAMINQLYKTALQDAKGYSANVKDALAIKNSYGVVQITQSNARQYGLTAADAGKYAVIFGDQSVKLYGSEKEATEYNGDNSKKTVYAEANRLTYGAEYALKEYSSTVYEKAQKLNELGISYDEYYNYYMTARYYSGKTKKDKILAYLNGSGLSKSQIALMMYYSGYSAYADEAKKAIKASSLSAERKKELLAGITN